MPMLEGDGAVDPYTVAGHHWKVAIGEDTLSQVKVRRVPPPLS